ncbi:hypothetical protein DRO31_00115, partial [Candidatus Bathyarchaeota archaeon]
AEYDNYLEVSRWDPRTDTFTTMFKDSYIIQQISVSSGKTMEQLLEELDRREQYIENMFKTGVENQREVAEKILSYYQNQREERENDTNEETHEEIIEETIESGDIDDLLENSGDEILPTENNWDNVDDLLNEIQGDDT